MRYMNATVSSRTCCYDAQELVLKTNEIKKSQHIGNIPHLCFGSGNVQSPPSVQEANWMIKCAKYDFLPYSVNEWVDSDLHVFKCTLSSE